MYFFKPLHLYFVMILYIVLATRCERAFNLDRFYQNLASSDSMKSAKAYDQLLAFETDRKLLVFAELINWYQVSIKGQIVLARLDTSLTFNVRDVVTHLKTNDIDAYSKLHYRLYKLSNNGDLNVKRISIRLLGFFDKTLSTTKIGTPLQIDIPDLLFEKLADDSLRECARVSLIRLDINAKTVDEKIAWYTRKQHIKEINFFYSYIYKEELQEGIADQYRQVAPFDSTVFVSFGGGESVSDYGLLISPDSTISEHHLELEQQFVNALLVRGEGGSGYFITDWKIYHSPWIKLESPKPFMYPLVPLSHKEATGFYPYEKTNIYDAVLNSKGEEMAQSLPPEYFPEGVPQKPANGYVRYMFPSIVTYLVKVRINVNVDGKWQQFTKIIIQNPIGGT